MTREDLDVRQVEDIRQSLHDESIELIDFDRLDEILKITASLAENNLKINRELEILKVDYRKRIIGMLKAVLACREDISISELAARLSDSDNDIHSSELTRLYCRTAASFRSRFPASFKYVTNQTDGKASTRKWTEFKI
jgi:hypothetical protein